MSLYFVLNGLTCLFMRDTYYHWSWGLWGPIEVVLGAQHNQILGNRVYFLSVEHVLKMVTR